MSLRQTPAGSRGQDIDLLESFSSNSDLAFSAVASQRGCMAPNLVSPHKPWVLTADKDVSKVVGGDGVSHACNVIHSSPRAGTTHALAHDPMVRSCAGSGGGPARYKEIAG